MLFSFFVLLRSELNLQRPNKMLMNIVREQKTPSQKVLL